MPLQNPARRLLAATVLVAIAGAPLGVSPRPWASPMPAGKTCTAKLKGSAPMKPSGIVESVMAVILGRERVVLSEGPRAAAQFAESANVGSAGRDFVVGDVHGMFDSVERALATLTA